MRLLVVAVGLILIGADVAREEEPLVIETDLLAPGKLDAGFGRDDLPHRVLGLEGRRVAVRGYLYPTFDERVSRFILVGETAGKPVLWANAGSEQLHHMIVVRLVPGEELATEPFSYADRPMIVEGRFVIDVRKRDGGVSLLYRIVDAKVRPAERREGRRSAIAIFGC